MDIAEARKNFEEMIKRLATLDTQVQFLVDYMDERGWLEEHCFTFPDGEIVWATQELNDSYLPRRT